MRYTILLAPDDGQYSVRVPAMPGIFTWGATSDEALASAREAIELHLEQYLERGLPFPPDRRRTHQGRTARLVTIDVAAPVRQVAS
jgi:antitoxin HicB